MEKKKNSKNIIKELNKTPRGKAILFFVGYFFFFLFLIIFLRSASSSSPVVNNYNQDSDFDFYISNITGNNYSFNHSIDIDNNVINYVGSRNDDYDLFTVNKVDGSYEYYRDYVEYFVNNSGLWISAENPYQYSRFFDIEDVVRILANSTLVYKTDYESGKKVYNYEVTTTSIHKLFEDVDLDVADDANEIMVKVNSNDQVYEIDLKLSSYCKTLNYCNDMMNIVLSYDKIGEIEKITSPLD